MAKDDTDKLSEKAMLVHVRISIFTAQVVDQKVSRKVEADMGAEEGVGTYIKSLVPKQQINDMRSLVKAVRREYEDVTLPWGKDGMRLLPTAQWGTFYDNIERRRAEFEKEVERFLDGYEDHRRNRRRLGKLGKDTDFLPRDEVRQRFAFDVAYAPVPAAGDFRLDLSKEHLELIRQDLVARSSAEYDAAIRDALSRIHNVVLKFYNQITGDDWVGVRGKTYEHMHELAAVFPSLNIRNDPKINEAIKVLNDQILVYDAGQLRNHMGSPVDARAKARAGAAAKKFLDKIKKVDPEFSRMIELADLAQDADDEDDA